MLSHLMRNLLLHILASYMKNLSHFISSDGSFELHFLRPKEVDTTVGIWHDVLSTTAQVDTQRFALFWLSCRMPTQHKDLLQFQFVRNLQNQYLDTSQNKH
jgi:hypothetical protein